MDLAAQLVLGGLLTGLPYALAAWGLASALGTGGPLNLAQGTFFMLGAYLAVKVTSQGLPAFDAAPVAAVAGLVLGAAIDRWLLRGLRGQPLAAAVVLLGLAIGAEAVVARLWGAATGSVPLRLPVVQLEHDVVAGVEQFIAAAGVAAFFTLVAISRWTRAGLAVRAAVHDPEIASCAGLNVQRLRTWAFAGSCAAGAAAGALLAPVMRLSPTMGRDALLLTLAAVTAGGPGLGGLIAASIGMGVAAQAAANFLVPPWTTAFAVAVLGGAAAWRRSPLWREAAA